MVYGQLPPAQQPPPAQYGAVPPGAPVYGQPAAPVQAMPPAEIKWNGLETGGAFKVPVTGFIGRLTEIVKNTDGQFGLRLIEKWDQVQILASPVPWPWATIEVSIKYSAKENSGWGHHVSFLLKLNCHYFLPKLSAVL